MPLTPGTRLGPYQIVSALGSGGMGEVYRAEDLRLHRTVAIKILPPEAATSDRVERFEREARAASALNHPNILTIHDVGREGQTAYLAMEWVEGQTLRKLLGAGAIPLRRTLHIARQIAEGLAKAHAADIVHRDLKPENVMVTGDGLVKIALLLAPVSARLKEWAYAGFAITLGSALIAHLSMADGPEAWGWAAATGVLWGLSYFFWRRVQTLGERLTAR